MDKEAFLEKLKQYEIVGRGGAGFPAWIKWKSTLENQSDTKYVVCNASEGEIGLFKDKYILTNYPQRVFKGLKIAMDFLDTREAYINFNANYYELTKLDIDPLVAEYETMGYHIHIYREHPSYIGGEASTALNSIEYGIHQPKLRTYRTSERGLFEKPTLVHNVETLYDIADVFDDKFEGKRFCCIFGEGIEGQKVYHLDRDFTLEQILKETENWPEFDFFVQVGGSASGPVFNSKQLSKQKMVGAGSIDIRKLRETTSLDLLKQWFRFYSQESCGKCTPCREGNYQIYKMVKDLERDDYINWKKIVRIARLMETTSFCGLGMGTYTPIKTYLENVLKIDIEKELM